MTLEIFQAIPDLKKILDKGFSADLIDGYLVIRDIPYLDNEGALQWADFLSKINLVNDRTLNSANIDHQMYFTGGVPHNIDGSVISGINVRQQSLSLSDPSLVVKYIFSNKPPNGYPSYFDKITTYLNVISAPAMHKHRANPFTRKLPRGFDYNGPFVQIDTFSARAELGDLNDNFRDERVAVIGLGGTGAYVLDLLSKTPVSEIIGFDADVFMTHNAFRSPGRLRKGELGQTKAKVYEARYRPFHKGVRCRSLYIDEGSEDHLAEVTFAFVCVDKGSSRGQIFSLLEKMNIPFIDVGMGLERQSGRISGLVRTTYYAKDEIAGQISRKLADMSDDNNDEYKTNIQIAELNAMNACLAVLKYKQLRGFYNDSLEHNYMLFNPTKSTLRGERYDG